MSSLESLMSGGDPRTLRNVDSVVASVLEQPSLMNELFGCLSSPDEIVRMRAADALEKVCRSRPALVEPYIDRLLVDFSGASQSSIRWHIAQIVGEVALTETQRAAAVAVLKENLEHATDWIVLNYSLDSFAKLARTDDTLIPYLTRQLERLSESKLKSVSKRAAKLLREFQ